MINNIEKQIANDHALTQYANEVLPMFRNTMAIVNAHYFEQIEETAKAIREQAPNLRNLWRVIADYTAALADLKSKIEFCIVDVFQKSPELQAEFKIQPGAKSIKCDASPEAMSELMERFVSAGYSPAALFSQCTAITAKKAADAFGLAQKEFLEQYGDLFATHENKPSVKMI